MRFAKVLAATLILTAFTASAAAAPAELRIFPDRSSTEINSFTSYEVEVINRGDNADRYRMTSPNSEVTIAPDNVPEQSSQVLEPGESRTVNVWYNPGPEKEAGTHTFTIRATSDASGDRYSIDGTVEVIKDHEVDVSVSEESAVCRGETATYDVEVTNEGIQEEEFELTTRYGSLSQQTVNLAPGETRTVTLTASSDSETQENFNVIAASTTSYAQDIESVQFNSEICYASDVNIEPQQLEAAAYAPSELQVTVRNTGTRADSFALSSNIGTFEDSALEVEGGSTETTTLTLTPTETGEQTVTVTAESQVTTTSEATINVYNGMDGEVSFSNDRVEVCEREQFELDAQLSNTGEAEETYTLSTTEGELESSEVTLGPNETADVPVTVDAADYSSGNQTVELTATASTFGEPTVSDSTTFSVQNCYDLNMTVNPSVASAGENRSTVYEIQLDNTGTLDNVYTVSAEGPDWISVRPEEVSVESGQTGYAYIYAGIPFGKQSGEVRITARANGTQVEKNRTVRLVIGEELEDAIESPENNGPSFRDRLPTADVVTSNLGRIGASIIVGLLVTAGVLYHEW